MTYHFATGYFFLLFRRQHCTNSYDNLDELYAVAYSEFNKLCTYFRVNKLSLHPDKTKYLLITYNNAPTNHNHRILINNNNPGETDS